MNDSFEHSVTKVNENEQSEPIDQNEKLNRNEQPISNEPMVVEEMPSTSQTIQSTGAIPKLPRIPRIQNIEQQSNQGNANQTNTPVVEQGQSEGLTMDMHARSTIQIENLKAELEVSEHEIKLKRALLLNKVEQHTPTAFATPTLGTH